MTQPTNRLRAGGFCVAGMVAVAVLTVAGNSNELNRLDQSAQPGVSGSVDALFVETAERTPPSSMTSQTIRRRAVRIREGAIASGAIVTAEAHVLNLFADVEIVAIRNRIETRDARHYSWFGTIPGDPLGQAILTVIDNTFGAVILSKGRRYVVLPRGSRHDVLELADVGVDDEEDDLKFDVGGVTLEPKGGRLPRAARAVPLDNRGLIRLVPSLLVEANGDVDPKFIKLTDNGSVIDVMFVFTHDAAHAADPSEVAALHSPPHTSTGLFLKIQQAIDLANQSCVASGVPTRLQWVGWPMELPTYTESGNFFTDLQAMAGGSVAGVLERRELLAADIVVLITATGTAGANGRSLHIRTLDDDDSPTTEEDAAATAFVAVKEAFLPEYTLAHEIGHQLGGVHDGSTMTNVPRYARGYVHPHADMGFRTIMARAATCGNLPCPRIGRWSDPNALHPDYGLPLGVPEFSHNPSFVKRAITENLKAVANYRLSLCRLMTTC